MTATDKNTTHLVTAAECDLCHSTQRWEPATFDHRNVMGNCVSCHDGMTATGVPTVHFMSSQDCNVS